MKNITKGMLAQSKAGHDIGNWYVIMDMDKDYVYLANGETRTLDRLKKKKYMHIQICYKTPKWFYDAIKTGEDITNEHIKKAIKEFKNNQQED